MRLAISVAAWSKDPDATLPPEYTQLPSELQAIGFSVLHAPVGVLATSISAALAGLEATDTLLVHVSGVLSAGGSIEVRGKDAVPLSVVADALAVRPCERTLVFVEAAYRGEEDAFCAVEQVEAVADALSSNAGSHTTIIAVHPISSDAAKLAFTHAVLDAVRDVAKPDGSATIADAYARAREREMGGVAASGFAFLRGGAPFPVGQALPLEAPAPAVTEPALTTPEPMRPLPPPPSVRTGPPQSVRPAPPVSVRAPVSVVPRSVAPAAPPRATQPPASVAPATTPSRAPAVPPPALSSPEWIDTSDIVETAPAEPLPKRIAAATAASDFRLLVRLWRERLLTLTTPEARVDELFEIARTLVAKLHDLPEAVLTLEEARGIDASRRDVLEALRRAYARLERWTEALEVTLALAKKTSDPRERATVRVAAALLACQHLADEEYALELLAAALDDNPSDEEALEELVRIRRSRGELAELGQTLAVVANRLVESGEPSRAWDACQRLAALRRDELGDTAGAVEALAISKRLPLSELDSRAVLAEQLLALGDDEGAVVELEAIVAAEPEHPRAHARLLSVHRRKGDYDRATLEALVLEEIGGADAATKEMLETYRANWKLRARTALDDAGWALLRAPGSDEAIEGVFRATLRAAVAAEFDERGSRQVLDPSRRQPESSTASIVRSFYWAARALGAPAPTLYVLDEVAGGIAAVSAPEPTTALGPDVLRGLSSKTLAFLAARHVTYFRPEYQVLVHFPTAEAMAELFYGAVGLVSPGVYVPENLAPLRVTTARHRLARNLRPEELCALSDAVGVLEARSVGIDWSTWIRSVELAAGRAGLFLSGDLQTALTQVRAEPRGLSGISIEDRRADLLAFCGSRALGDLRATYTDTSPSSSARPPTTESAVVRMDDPSLRESGERQASTRLMA